ncbi:MAG TPA: malectin domain-containing carbohydrate-binding protein [Armatimonadota bacterium]|jgi:hypothetical protein
MKKRVRSVIPVLLALAAPCGARVAVVCPRGASPMERLGALEVRRYFYLRTGEMPEIVEIAPRTGDVVTVANAPNPSRLGLKPQQYLLKTSTERNRRLVTVAGGDSPGTLYGAYALCERLGVRFYLHSDVIPDKRIPARLPIINERGRPLFALRGIQPFHDFPEGPDWWSEDACRAVIGQLPKLRMNFIGLHTYPEPIAEPATWIGQVSDMDANGRVNAGYPAAWFNTALTTWGYTAKKTSDYSFGADLLYDRDDYGSDVMRGLTPRPATAQQGAQVFSRAASMLRTAFTDAKALGVKTCIGTETPLTVPSQVKARLKAAGKDPADAGAVRELYKGIFLRLMRACPVDFYWLWTPEGWTWDGASPEQVSATLNDMKAADAAARSAKAPFKMAACGWVLGPQNDRSLLDRELPRDWSLSAINRSVGMSPVEPGFADVRKHGKWAIPWLEDDPGLTAPQLWAGRMRADAADALDYGCNGLMGIHWRTRVVGPNVSALAKAAWDQSPWRRALPKQVETVQGQVSSFPGAAIADTTEAPVYRDVRYEMSAYRLAIPNGTYTVTLKFCEPYYSEAGKRVFDVSIQGRPVLENLDVFARVGKDRALDYTYPGVKVNDGKLNIAFGKRVEFPCIAGIAVETPGFSRKINCGGPAWRDYEADIVEAPRDRPIIDFYRDWAAVEFGPEIGTAAAALFAKLDGKLPRPVGWIDGPGGLGPDNRAWSEAAPEYAFVDEFAALGIRVTGAGERDRYGYWLAQFRYLRATARLRCDWGTFERAMGEVKAVPGADKARMAVERALPARVAMVKDLREVYTQMLRFVSSPGEMGTITNWEQHIGTGLMGRTGADLAAALGKALPPESLPGKGYAGPLRVFVPVVRTSAMRHERLKLQATVLSAASPASFTLCWRPMGRGSFRTVPVRHIARGVYSVALPSATEDFEYYVKVVDKAGEKAVWPASAPAICQTVVVWGNGK